MMKGLLLAFLSNCAFYLVFESALAWAAVGRSRSPSPADTAAPGPRCPPPEARGRRRDRAGGAPARPAASARPVWALSLIHI